MLKPYLILAPITVVVSTSVTSAQTTPQPPVCCSAPVITAPAFDSSIGVYTKTGGAPTVTALISTVDVHALGLDWSLGVPVYTSDTSGYGSITVDTSWNALAAVNFLGANTGVRVGGGVFLPTGSAGYESTNTNPHINGEVQMEWGTWSLTQSADWRFVTGGSMYDPLLGTFSQDLATLVTGLHYKWTDTLALGVDLGQYYLGGGNGTVTVTPGVKWAAADAVDVSVGVGFPVWQNLQVDNTVVVNAGVSFKF